MIPRIFSLFVFCSLLVVMTTPVGISRSQEGSGTGQPLVLGLDHIPLAVTDLEDAMEQYGRLGFELKPGRSHENGIRNQHVKFPNRTGLELITASESRDPQTTEYLRHLAAGDGPAFVGFYAADLDAVARKLDVDSRTYRRDGGFLDAAGIGPDKRLQRVRSANRSARHLA